MKKFITVSLVLMFALFSSYNVQAQQNVVYDGDFSVWLKLSNDYTSVLEVYFSYDGEWNLFAIDDYEEFEGEDRGFSYEVRDNYDKIFWVDYYYDEDYILVTNDSTGENWTLYRRDE
jgi:hypothetical protein